MKNRAKLARIKERKSAEGFFKFFSEKGFPGYEIVKMDGGKTDTNVFLEEPVQTGPVFYVEPKNAPRCKKCQSSDVEEIETYEKDVFNFMVMNVNSKVRVKIRKIVCHKCGYEGEEYVKWIADDGLNYRNS